MYKILHVKGLSMCRAHGAWSINVSYCCYQQSCMHGYVCNGWWYYWERENYHSLFWASTSLIRRQWTGKYGFLFYLCACPFLAVHERILLYCLYFRLFGDYGLWCIHYSLQYPMECIHLKKSKEGLHVYVCEYVKLINQLAWKFDCHICLLRIHCPWATQLISIFSWQPLCFSWAINHSNVLSLNSSQLYCKTLYNQ